MTYCVGLMLDRGLVFMSDTRTNSGVDNIATYGKMFRWHRPGERSIVMMTAGNPGHVPGGGEPPRRTVQGTGGSQPVHPRSPHDVPGRQPGWPDAQGSDRRDGRGWPAGGIDVQRDAHRPGQIAGMPPRLFLIYPEGNFIEASAETPFLQIGETKYGKPILVRANDPTMTFEDAVTLLLVSFDSTIKANLSVGLPLDLQIVETDHLHMAPQMRLTAEHPGYQAVASQWGDALRSAFASLPPFEFPD